MPGASALFPTMVQGDAHYGWRSGSSKSQNPATMFDNYVQSQKMVRTYLTHTRWDSISGAKNTKIEL